jgi:hypothetical protein
LIGNIIEDIIDQLKSHAQIHTESGKSFFLFWG